MLPDEPVSTNIGPPWTPLAWRFTPDQLVQQAQAQLWEDVHDVQTVLSGTGYVMAGDGTSSVNESDELIPAGRPAPAPLRGGARAQEWQQAMHDLHRVEPLAAWANGVHDGPPNPAP